MSEEKKVSRRGYAKYAGAGIVVIAVAGAGAYYATRAPTSGPSQDKYKVKLVMTMPINDWDFGQTGYRIYQDVEAAVGNDPNIEEVSYLEKVQMSDVERAVRDVIDSGVNIPILWGGEFAPVAQSLAPEFPNVYFLVGAVQHGALKLDNVSVVDDKLFEGHYLSGLIAGSLTKSNIIGMMVGEAYPKLILMVEAFKMGVREVNPKVKFLYTALGTWIDPTKGGQMANSMMDGGADFVWSNSAQCDLGVGKAVSDRFKAGKKIYCAFGWVDKYELFPEVLVTTAVGRTGKAFSRVIQSILDGEYTPGDVDLGIKSGDVEMAPYRQFADEIPKDIQELVQEKIAAMKAGTFSVPEVSELTSMEPIS